MDHSFYLHQLYPFQDQVLQLIHALDTGFHLTGGTALSRGYLHHRFSDDLDLFVNDDEHFPLWADRVIQSLMNHPWTLNVLQREERFTRLNLQQANLALKIDLVNDVPSRVGMPWLHSMLGMIDTVENILANKVTALISRSEPKDLADVWAICTQLKLSLPTAIGGAQGKAAGIFPADLARALCSVTKLDWELVRWSVPPDPEQYRLELQALGEELLLGG